MNTDYLSAKKVALSAITTCAIITLVLFTLSLSIDGFNFAESVFGYGYGYSSGGGGGGAPAPDNSPTPTPEPDEETVEMPSPGSSGVVQDVAAIVSDEGDCTETVTIASNDGNTAITIPVGTVATDENGDGLDWISIKRVDDPPPPPERIDIVLAVDFGPDGATFNPPVELSIELTDEDLLTIDPDNLTMAYYDESAGKWVELVNVTIYGNQVIAQVSHFTKFAVLIPDEVDTTAENEVIVVVPEPVTTSIPEPFAVPESSAVPEPSIELEPDITPNPAETEIPEAVGEEFQPLTSKTMNETESGTSIPWMIIAPAITAVIVVLLLALESRRQKNLAR